MFNKWINAYKKQGLSSNKFLTRIKKNLLERTGNKVKIGYLGTLDPFATGVLPIALGKSTKVIEFLNELRKSYLFTIQFGSKTDTADLTGAVIETNNNFPSKELVYNVVDLFKGKITQIPPNYSAIKINGVRAYKRARNNEQFILNAREITIYSLECMGYDEEKNQATYEVECSSGTYIRSLAEDIASSLQTLAYVVVLTRIRVGKFMLSNAIQIEDLEESIALEELLLPIHFAIDLPKAFILREEMVKKVKDGKQVAVDYTEPLINSSKICWLFYNQEAIALGSLDSEIFTPQKLLI